MPEKKKRLEELVKEYAEYINIIRKKVKEAKIEEQEKIREKSREQQKRS
jgi:Sec-independent protein translocase protein TatA